MNETLSVISIDPRTQLRPLTFSDAADIFAAVDSHRQYMGEWLPFVEHTLRVEDSMNYVSSVLSDGNGGSSETVFTIRRDGKFAGLVGIKLSPSGLMNRRAEIGYWLSYDFQHQGIMTSAVREIADYAFRKMGMRRVEIKCAVGNTPSRNIPLRLGFRHEGTERCGELLSGGRFVDIDVFSLLSNE